MNVFERHRMTPGKVSLLALVLLLLLAVACTKQEPPNDGAICTEFPAFCEPTPIADASSDLDIYIDGSMSMRGYANAANSNYKRVLSDLLKSAMEAQFNLSVYKFADAVTPIPHFVINDLLAPTFYNGRDTPIADLLDRLNRTPSHATLIISDFVQSQHGQDTLALVRALGQLADKRPQMQLLAYRSNFEGDYYPEAHPGTIQLGISQSLPGTGRPFYILIVAPSATSMQKVEDYLISRSPMVHSFKPTAAPILINQADLLHDGTKDLLWSLYAGPARRDTADGRRIESAFMLNAVPSGPNVILPLTLNVQFNLPIRDVNRLHLEAVRATWDKNSFGKAVEADLPMEGGIDTEDRLHVHLTLRQPLPNTWDTYYVKIRSGDGNLDAPPWVSDWSTDDDSLATNGNRTFQLQVLVQALEEAVSEKIVFCEYLLRVGRRS
jgi:hypothetical protein